MYNRGVVVWAAIINFKINQSFFHFNCSTTQFSQSPLLCKSTMWLCFIISQPHSASRVSLYVAFGAFKVSVCSLQSRSQCLRCPSMMDDGVYRSSIPLALFPLIGLKQVRLDSTSMVTGRVYVWIISARPSRRLPVWWRQGLIRTVPKPPE